MITTLREAWIPGKSHFGFKFVNPAWVTNPASLALGLVMEIER